MYLIQLADKYRMEKYFVEILVCRQHIFVFCFFLIFFRYCPSVSVIRLLLPPIART